MHILHWYCHTAPPIRLAGGRSNKEGRVEVFLHGEWGTVCDDYWDINSAHVVCHELGFSSASATYGNAWFGEGDGRIWMDDMRCSGEESHLINCPQNIIGSHDCSHSEDVSVICIGKLVINCSLGCLTIIPLLQAPLLSSTKTLQLSEQLILRCITWIKLMLVWLNFVDRYSCTHTIMYIVITGCTL